jgi:hypothetical protein
MTIVGCTVGLVIGVLAPPCALPVNDVVGIGLTPLALPLLPFATVLSTEDPDEFAFLNCVGAKPTVPDGV